MTRKPVIAVVGSGLEAEPAVTNARVLGRLIAEKGWILITGGRNVGVMQAANEGAKRARDSLTVGILPSRETEASSGVDVAIITDIGEARNNIIVLSADVVIACGVEDAGTASEVSLAIKAGTSVVFLGVSEAAKEYFMEIGVDQIIIADSPKEAIEITAGLVKKSRPAGQIQS